MPEIWFYHLGIKINHLSNTAFSIGGFPVYFYGICIAAALITGYFTAMKQAQYLGKDFGIYSDFFIWGAVISICGARLGYIIFSEDTYLTDFFKFRDGGLQIYGGLIAGVIAAFVFTRIKRIKFLDFTDGCALGFVIGQAIGRWGNFFNREAFGRATDSLFAMRMNIEQVKGVHSSDIAGDMLNYNGSLYPIIKSGGVKYIQAHPTFLYESLWCVGVFIILIILMKHGRQFCGKLTAWYFILYGLGRFWIESLRTDQLKFSGLPVSMIISCALIIIGLAIILYEYKFKEKFTGGKSNGNRSS